MDFEEKMRASADFCAILFFSSRLHAFSFSCAHCVIDSVIKLLFSFIVQVHILDKINPRKKTFAFFFAVVTAPTLVFAFLEFLLLHGESPLLNVHLGIVGHWPLVLVVM